MSENDKEPKPGIDPVRYPLTGPRLLLLAIVLGAVALGAAVVAEGLPTGSGKTGVKALAIPGIPDPVAEAIANARHEGVISGQIQWVSTRPSKVSGITAVNVGNTGPMYVIQTQGEFQDSPRGIPGERGSFLIQFIPTGPNSNGDHGANYSDKALDLSQFGPLHTLTLSSP